MSTARFVRLVVFALSAFAALQLPAIVFAQTSSVPQPIREPLGVRDRDIDKYIDRPIQGYKRAVIRQIMLRLPPPARYNVYYRAPNGEVFSNRIDVLLRSQRPDTILPDGRVRKPDGETITPAMPIHNPARPSVVPTPPGSDSTGPYRRVFSQTGYTSMAGYVDTPCSVSNLTPRSADTGHVYTGGFTPGDSVDAGLQWSPT